MPRLSATFPILSVLMGAVALLIVSGGRRGALVSPFSTCVFILVSIFGVRPLLMLEERNFEFYGIDVITGFNSAAFLGALSIALLVVGYVFRRCSGFLCPIQGAVG